jgi:hypothetical protein
LETSRRGFLAATGAGALGALCLKGLGARKAKADPAPKARAAIDRTLAWVWRWGDDGDPGSIRDRLAQQRMAAMVKTHDGTSWMSRWDRAQAAMSGPSQVREIADYFEAAGVPFHAWGVTRGVDPAGEAHIAAEVLASGARSFTFDLEPPEGNSYWHGSPDSAARLGEELRKIAPKAYLAVTPDPRPWRVAMVPMAEFASFCNEIMPQTYWRIFNSPANHRRLNQSGFATSEVNPHNILFISNLVLQKYGRTLRPIGQADASREEWLWFLQEAQTFGMAAPSFWRFRTADAGMWQAFEEIRAHQEAQSLALAQSQAQMHAQEVAQVPNGPTPSLPQADNALEPQSLGERNPAVDVDDLRNPYGVGPRFETQYRITGRLSGVEGVFE